LEFGNIMGTLFSDLVSRTSTLFTRQRLAFLERIKTLDEERQAFIGGQAFNKNNCHRETDALTAALALGTKPSAYAQQHLSWILEKGFISADHWPELLSVLDAVLERPYPTGWERRPYRSPDYTLYTDRISIMLRSFVQDALLPFTVADLLTGNVPELDAESIYKSHSDPHLTLTARIALALDRNEEAVNQAVRDLIEGNAKPVFLAEVISGALWSHRPDMHELIGRLLLAARLQEGLRQTICENADMGTPEAFLALIDVIEQHGLIRFSSVKRAVGTWLGLLDAEAGHLERVSDKSISLISRCLHDADFVEECLSGEDSMQIHIALWSIGVHNVQKACARAQQLAEQGTHHQRLCAGYFAQNLQLPDYAASLAMRVLQVHGNEPDTVAMYLSMAISSPLYSLAYKLKGTEPWRKYFASVEEAQSFRTLLVDIRSRTPKKLEFSPIVFPWHAVTLEKSDLAECICVIDRLLDDDQLIDASADYFAECSPGGRYCLLRHSYNRMRTPRQRQVVLSALSDRSEDCRKNAVLLMDPLNLTSAEYAEIEKMLRFKYANSRQAIIRWLMKQNDDDLLGSITRLLGDAKSEERRMAALDMIKQLTDENTRAHLIRRCRPLLTAYSSPTQKEKPLVDSLLTKLGACPEEEAPQEEPLFTEADICIPAMADVPEAARAVQVFMRYFPSSRLAEQLGTSVDTDFAAFSDIRAQAEADLNGLLACHREHRLDPVTDASGETTLMANLSGPYGAQMQVSSLRKEWDQWYVYHIGDPQRLLRMYVLACGSKADRLYSVMADIFGDGYQNGLLDVQDENHTFIRHLTEDLLKRHMPKDDRKFMAAALLLWMGQRAQDESLWHDTLSQYFTVSPLGGFPMQHIMRIEPFALMLSFLEYDHCEALLPALISAAMHLYQNSAQAFRRCEAQRKERMPVQGIPQRYMHAIGNDTLMFLPYELFPSLSLLLRAAYRGILSPRTLYAWMMTGSPVKGAIQELTLLANAHRAAGQQHTSRNAFLWRVMARQAEKCMYIYLGKKAPETEQDMAMLAYADQICTPLLRRIIDAEIKRGDTATPYSFMVSSISHIWGAEDFTAILAALGKDTLLRSFFSTPQGFGRTESLCTMLGVCIPTANDTAENLRKLMKQHKISEKRMIEAALYAPEWIDLVGEALNLPGFRSAAYYFISHMNEEADDVRKARIARFTPLSIEELQNGAFDIDWFRSAYAEVGETYFDMIYSAAKYLSSSAQHARARKYADAVLGRLDQAAVKQEIIAKRNKDLLMAYALIPISGEEDLQARYLYIQQFLKESRSFGAQRSASEKTAAEIALTNLALNAGYTDSMRLTLRMETRLTEENQDLFEPRLIDGVTVHLTVDAQGTADILCSKGGKALKSIPAGLKKNEYVLRLTDMKKQLVQQQRRAKGMLEEAMEASTVFSAGEIASLMQNPVIAPMLSKVVFQQGDRFGFTDGRTLTDVHGVSISLCEDDPLTVAHPFHLWKAQCWLDFQQKLYDELIVQPFRQVFRELYIKTPDELGREMSLRYAGNQLQPARTMACLKTRRWIADAEAGLQKVCYKDNIVASIWAEADWFTPADIEAPTLDYVAFQNRKTGMPVRIDDVPDVLFSEIMRDVDLAVSVAHAGGVDPETSHSTMEMRAALLSFTLPLFRLTNVEIRDHHAIITGTLAKYSVHLGSGVVHQIGGTMLSVLPVHSQHRGKLFLPFVDEDPKTAEILSKVLLFAEDARIKDPTILNQISR